MQFTFRIDSDNYITYKLSLQNVSNGEFRDGTEVVAAVIADKKLSNIEMDDLLDVAGQLLDHVTPRHRPTADSPNEDWRDLFRRGEL